MIFPDWQRHKARTEPRCQARCAVSTRKGEVYGWSLREFGKGLRSHFLPYLNDTADYTFKLSLIMYICSVNYNTKARVMFWKGGTKQITSYGVELDRNFFSFLFFLTNTGKLVSPTDYSNLVPIALNIRTPLSLVEKRTHWATCPLHRSHHNVVRSEERWKMWNHLFLARWYLGIPGERKVTWAKGSTCLTFRNHQHLLVSMVPVPLKVASRSTEGKSSCLSSLCISLPAQNKEALRAQHAVIG